MGWYLSGAVDGEVVKVTAKPHLTAAANLDLRNENIKGIS